MELGAILVSLILRGTKVKAVSCCSLHVCALGMCRLEMLREKGEVAVGFEKFLSNFPNGIEVSEALL